MRMVLLGAAFFWGSLLYLSVNTGFSLEVHDDIVKIGCLECHEKLPFVGYKSSLTESMSERCLECHHRHRYFSHPIAIIPSMSVPADMPLGKNNELTCVTCHTFHKGYRDGESGDKPFFLRRTMTGRIFCFSCHKTPLELQ